jgi:hypothetical protein
MINGELEMENVTEVTTIPQNVDGTEETVLVQMNTIGDESSNGGVYYNTEECGWDGGDCIVTAI